MLKSAKIVFEDEWILVVNKPAGLVVNRSQTNREDTLQDELSDYLDLGSSLGIGDRAGIVHRLDRETSGLLVVAKKQKAFDDLQAQFKAREVKKEYIALVHGLIKDESGTVESKIARVGKFGKFGVVEHRSVEGREAKTDFTVTHSYTINDENFNNLADSRGEISKHRKRYLDANARDYSLLQVFPKTGRTHQIRVHLKYIGHPLVSDLIYGPGKLIKFDLQWCPRLFLHASSLEFSHPKAGKRMTFIADLPQDLKYALRSLTINH